MGVNTALDIPLDCSRTPYGGVGFTVLSQSTISFTYGVRVKVQVRAVFLATDDPTKTMGLEWVLFLILYPVRQFIVLVMSLGCYTQLQNGGNPMLGQGQGQGIGQDRSLCNGRSYKGYGVMVCFILFTPMGSRSRSRSVPCALQRTFLLGLWG